MAVQKGTLICKSQPFAYILNKECRGKRCDFCLQLNEKLHRCTGCSYFYFCDKNCQKKAWKDHKQECCNIKKVSPLTPTNFLLLLSRVIYKLKFQKDTGEKVGSITRYFKNLQSHVENIQNDNERMEQLRILQHVLKDFLSSDVLPTNPELIEIFGKIVINSYSICDEEAQTIAVGLYLGASVFDHSCQPNASVVFEGPTLFVYSIEFLPVLDYSKIFIPYIELLATKEERKKELESTYYFDCKCIRCLDDKNDDELNSIKCPTINCNEPVIIKEEFFTCPSCGDLKINEEVLESSNEAMDLCKRTWKNLDELKKLNQFEILLESAEDILKSCRSFLHPLNINYVRIADIALDACIHLQHTQRAYELANLILPCFRKCYGPLHPIVGIQYLKIGKLAMSLDKLNVAKENFLQAADVINITHGPNHRLRSVCYTVLSELNSRQ